MNSKIALVGSLSCLLIFPACRSTHPQTPSAPVPYGESWSADYADTVSPGTPGLHDSWLHEFNDPVLVQLVEEALEHNHDLKAAAARVTQAKALARIASAGRLPVDQVRASGQVTERPLTPASGKRERTETYGAALDIRWEIDLWGSLRDQTRSAHAALLAAGEDYRSARLSLAAQTALAWYDAITAEHQLQLAEGTLLNFNQNLTIVENLYRRGLSQALDLHLLRSKTESARSLVARRQLQLDRTRRRLEILLGRYPSGELATTFDLPEPPRSVPAGLPAELLERRPDLVAWRHQLAGAGFQAAAARKSLLPRLDLTGSLGFAAMDAGDLFDPASRLWSLAGNATAPLLQRRALQGRADAAEAVQEQLLEGYRQAVLRAFLEVEHALQSEAILTREAQAVQAAMTAAKDAETTAWDAYHKGLSDILTVIIAERHAFETRSQYLQIKNERLHNRIQLILALGGSLFEEDRSSPGHPGDQYT